MSKIDTSTAAVERLAKLIAMHGDDQDTAALSALLAERDEAIDQRNASDFVLAIAISQSSHHSAERDAARAEVEALRDALSAARDNIAGRFGADATNTIDAALIARIDAAIAKEPGHE